MATAYAAGRCMNWPTGAGEGSVYDRQKHRRKMTKVMMMVVNAFL